eukprot:GHVT01048799.1.p1 GENE.GHVT01048799.1~~GHVT01048799.1.p1  ORF type:complete len:453 (+),score=86.90 GHVT01048799.1:789-2147(+)
MFSTSGRSGTVLRAEAGAARDPEWGNSTLSGPHQDIRSFAAASLEKADRAAAAAAAEAAGDTTVAGCSPSLSCQSDGENDPDEHLDNRIREFFTDLESVHQQPLISPAIEEPTPHRPQSNRQDQETELNTKNTTPFTRQSPPVELSHIPVAALDATKAASASSSTTETAPKTAPQNASQNPCSVAPDPPADHVPSSAVAGSGWEGLYSDFAAKPIVSGAADSSVRVSIHSSQGAAGSSRQTSARSTKVASRASMASDASSIGNDPYHDLVHMPEAGGSVSVVSERYTQGGINMAERSPACPGGGTGWDQGLDAFSSLPSDLDDGLWGEVDGVDDSWAGKRGRWGDDLLGSGSNWCEALSSTSSAVDLSAAAQLRCRVATLEVEIEDRTQTAKGLKRALDEMKHREEKLRAHFKEKLKTELNNQKVGTATILQKKRKKNERKNDKESREKKSK